VEIAAREMIIRFMVGSFILRCPSRGH